MPCRAGLDDVSLPSNKFSNRGSSINCNSLKTACWCHTSSTTVKTPYKSQIYTQSPHGAHVVPHSCVSSHRKQHTLLREAQVDHLRGHRAGVEISEHVFKWFVCCLHFLSVELHNNSNQLKWREGGRWNKQTYYRKRRASGNECFVGACVIQSQICCCFDCARFITNRKCRCLSSKKTIYGLALNWKNRFNIFCLLKSYLLGLTQSMLQATKALFKHRQSKWFLWIFHLSLQPSVLLSAHVCHCHNNIRFERDQKGAKAKCWAHVFAPHA